VNRITTGRGHRGKRANLRQEEKETGGKKTTIKSARGGNYCRDERIKKKKNSTGRPTGKKGREHKLPRQKKDIR